MIRQIVPVIYDSNWEAISPEIRVALLLSQLEWVTTSCTAGVSLQNLCLFGPCRYSCIYLCTYPSPLPITTHLYFLWYRIELNTPPPQDIMPRVCLLIMRIIVSSWNWVFVVVFSTRYWWIYCTRKKPRKKPLPLSSWHTNTVTLNMQL